MSTVEPDRQEILTTLEPLCPTVPPDLLQDFVTRMDQEYFRRMAPETIAKHIHLAAELTPDHLCELSVTELQQDHFELTIVAYDYFAEFATICGLLSAFELNIEEGQIYTSAEAAPPAPSKFTYGSGPRSRPGTSPGLTRKKIVDLFRVQTVRGATFGPNEQQRLRQELREVIALLDTGDFEEARHEVNRQLVEQLGKRRGSFSGLLHPVQITFDNSQSPTDTVMDIRSDDTPAFLYAFANALTMRNIYIAKAQIEIEGGKLHDRFYVRNRYGQKLTDVEDQQQLRLTAVLIKQFTHALTWAPDPTKALEAFDQFLDLIVQETQGKKRQEVLAFLSDKKTFPLLAKLLGASDFLWEDFLRRQHDNLLPLLQDYRDAPLIKPQNALKKELDKLVNKAKSDEAKKTALNQFKDRELFRIDMKHIVEAGTSLADFSLALTQLAEAILDRSLADCRAKLKKQYGEPRLANKKPCPFAILGAGKFGGRELGYASDIEVLFVYGGAGRTTGKQKIENSEYFERLAQELLQWIEAKQEGIFHLDTRLRPHGGKGSLANPLDEITNYYSHRISRPLRAPGIDQAAACSRRRLTREAGRSPSRCVRLQRQIMGPPHRVGPETTTTPATRRAKHIEREAQPRWRRRYRICDPISTAHARPPACRPSNAERDAGLSGVGGLRDRQQTGRRASPEGLSVHSDADRRVTDGARQCEGLSAAAGRF